MSAMYTYNARPKVRASGFLVEDGCLLCVKQKLRERSNWNIPGGALDPGETLRECVVREMREETGLSVEVVELLYVCDRKRDSGRFELDISFLVRRTGGTLRHEYRGPDGEVLSEVKFVPVKQLASYGFAPEFQELAECGFPNRGKYMGDFHALFGRTESAVSTVA